MLLIGHDFGDPHCKCARLYAFYALGPVAVHDHLGTILIDYAIPYDRQSYNFIGFVYYLMRDYDHWFSASEW